MDISIHTIGPKQDDPHVPPPPSPEKLKIKTPIREIGPKQDDPHVPPGPKDVVIKDRINVIPKPR